MFTVATNVVAQWLPEHRPTGTLIAHAIRKFLAQILAMLPQFEDKYNLWKFCIENALKKLNIA